jgi:hypothetical protein
MRYVMISKGGQISMPAEVRKRWKTRRLQARYYRRRDNAVSLADCCLVAVATRADRIATADPAVLAMAEAEGIGTVPLPRP